MAADAQFEAERLWARVHPGLLPEDCRAAISVCSDTPAAPWRSLSSGEQALCRLVFSLWGAPGWSTRLYNDLGALDDHHRVEVIASIAQVCGVPLARQA